MHKHGELHLMSSHVYNSCLALRRSHHLSLSKIVYGVLILVLINKISSMSIDTYTHKQHKQQADCSYHYRPRSNTDQDQDTEQDQNIEESLDILYHPIILTLPSFIQHKEVPDLILSKRRTYTRDLLSIILLENHI
jgi:hypothetical protein